MEKTIFSPWNTFPAEPCSTVLRFMPPPTQKLALVISVPMTSRRTGKSRTPTSLAGKIANKDGDICHGKPLCWKHFPPKFPPRTSSRGSHASPRAESTPPARETPSGIQKCTPLMEVQSHEDILRRRTSAATTLTRCLTKSDSSHAPMPSATGINSPGYLAQEDHGLVAEGFVAELFERCREKRRTRETLEAPHVIHVHNIIPPAVPPEAVAAVRAITAHGYDPPSPHPDPDASSYISRVAPSSRLVRVIRRGYRVPRVPRVPRKGGWDAAAPNRCQVPGCGENKQWSCR